MQGNPDNSTPRLEGVLFDLDGTLIDTHDLILASFRHATTAVLGRIIPDSILMAKVGVPLEVQLEDFSDDPDLRRQMLQVYREYNHAFHDEMVRSFAGVEESLRALNADGVRLGVVTSKRRQLAVRGLERFGLEGFFEFVIGSDDCRLHKPDPAPVLMGCERMGLDPSRCAYVGDSPFDVAAGRDAGCLPVAAVWGMFPEADLLAQRPGLVFRSPFELAGLAGLAG